MSTVASPPSSSTKKRSGSSLAPWSHPELSADSLVTSVSVKGCYFDVMFASCYYSIDIKAQRMSVKLRYVRHYSYELVSPPSHWEQNQVGTTPRIPKTKSPTPKTWFHTCTFKTIKYVKCKRTFKPNPEKNKNGI